LPEIRARLTADGVDVAGGSPERFFDLLKRDVAKWRKVVRIGNIQPGG